MNEIVRLNQEMKEMKSLHIQELGDWERLHMNEMREKEFEIAQLHEEIRKLTVGTTHARKQKKLLGMARQYRAGGYHTTACKRMECIVTYVDSCRSILVFGWDVLLQLDNHL